ncbi:hypothetical protein BDV19DRAFT_364416 [Aspergillus venezuelensis]
MYLFVQHRFAKIKRKKSILEDWPRKDVIQKLARMSASLFISAATVCRYMKVRNWNPNHTSQSF